MSDWLTYSPISGHGNGTIVITASTSSELEDRISILQAYNNEESLSVTSEIIQTYKDVTGITLTNLTWVNNIPWYGGVATKSNCSYNIIAYYDDGTTSDITQLAEVSGETIVGSSSAQTITTAGTLSLTATYEQFTATASTTFVSTATTTIYQDEFENIDLEKEYLTIAVIEDGRIGIQSPVLYSINGGNWTEIENGGLGYFIELNLNKGDKVRLKRNSNVPYYDDAENQFIGGNYDFPAKFVAYGNIMSLYDADSFSSRTSFILYSYYGDKYLTPNRLFVYSNIMSAKYLILPVTTLVEGCYKQMFGSCLNLLEAPSLPSAATLADSCYRYMFGNCTGLTTTPTLPATALTPYCYEGMFEGCESITTAPALPATTLATACYEGMFEGCTSLTTAPALPATTLADRCYKDMFYNCTSLTTTPTLPATTLTDYCYDHMFCNTPLTTVPTLPATVLAPYCYLCMFADTDITTVPYNYLPNTTLAEGCYMGMFQSCTELVSPPELPATALTPYCYAHMFDGCWRHLETPPALPATVLAPYCYDGMFVDCDKITTPPALPATTLAVGCYRMMFFNCYFTTAPELPATTLVEECYYLMFAKSSMLNYIKCLATDISATNCTYRWVESPISSTGTFVKNPSMTSWTRGDNGIPGNWTIQDAT